MWFAMHAPNRLRNLFLLYRCIPALCKKRSLTESTLENLKSSLKNPASHYSRLAVALDEQFVGGCTTAEECFIDSLCASIKTFTSQGQLSNAFETFSLLQHRLSTSTHKLHSVSSLLLSCTVLKALAQGKQLHALIITLGFDQGALLVPKLVTFYVNFDLLMDARLVVEASNVGLVVPWNVLISAYVRCRLSGVALSAYECMMKKGIKPDNFTFPTILKACGDEGNLDFGREVYRTIVASGLEWNLFVHNALVSMYVKCDSVAEARALFERMPERDTVSWNAMISGYATKGMWGQVSELFERMRTSNVKGDNVSWNAVAGGKMQTGSYVEALKLISKMRVVCESLDCVALVIGIAACSRIGFIKLGKEIHGYAIRMLRDEDESVTNALITMYCRCEDLRHAYVLFQLAEMKTVITWNSMIAGYAHLDYSEEASFLFREMVYFGVEPNDATMASILPLCARVANLQHGRELHCYVMKQRFEEYLLIWNALVDMYAKAGRVAEAQRVFDLMNQKDQVSYTSLIAGYGMKGEGVTALKLFTDMIRHGIKPDHITMVSVLSACSHSGLVIQGQLFFEKMDSSYGLTPKLEHFACMVDLFGRAGLLRNAKEIIRSMPFKPSPPMWATLIGACRIHGNVEIGEWAAEKLLEMRPGNPGYYVLIANMYAAAGCWSKLAEVRTLMRDLGLRKYPGCAWIDVGDGFHSFLVGDRSSPHAQGIHHLLDGLDLQMREFGYIMMEDLELEDDF